MKPYYEEPGIAIYHGDCRDIMPHLGLTDAVITDPPYGLNIGTGNNQSKSGGYGGHLAKASYLSYDDSYENFCSIIVPSLTEAIKTTGRAAVFTGPHIHEQLKPDCIGGIYSPAATGRTAWGSKNFLPILLYGVPPKAGQHRPTVLYSTATSEKNGHPCPKPIEWMRWLVKLVTRIGETAVDPFMGSGTTLVAAKSLGVSAIGIDIEERYCEMAVERLRQSVLSFEDAA